MYIFLERIDETKNKHQLAKKAQIDATGKLMKSLLA